jgi:predicted nucleic acid-binding Zn finger protein
MRQLETSKQIVKTEQKYKRECKGRALALTRSVYRLVNSDVFYVQSESSNEIYYFVKFKPDVSEFCSCLDSSTRRNVRCKHSFGVEYAIRLGTLKDIDRLPTEAKVSKQKVISIAQPPMLSISYKDDDYSF